MGVSIVRFQGQHGAEWGAVRGESVVSLGLASTLAEFLQSDWRAILAVTKPSRKFSELQILSPITAPCQVICQGKNYLDHVVETGTKPRDKDFNIFFTKADSTLAPAHGIIRRPKRVKLLDYELELGLVLGKEIHAESLITAENLPEYVAGFVMANDVSARDIQVPEKQWFKGKSFRGFCPVGPILYIPGPAEFPSLFDMSLELKVNGQVKQKSNTKMLIFGPVETLKEVAEVFDMRPGDLLLTGTPGGVAMRIKPKAWWQEVAGVFKGEKEKFAEFIAEQAAGGRYLKTGDQIESTIRAANGSFDLGVQRLVIEG